MKFLLRLWTMLLWRSLADPPPIHRAFETRQSTASLRMMPVMIGVVGLLILLLVIAPALALTAALIISLVVLASITIFNGTALGLYWSGRIAAQIALWNLTTRLELLELTPLGSLGSAWLLAVSAVHEAGWLRTVSRIFRSLILIVVILLLLAYFFMLSDLFSRRSIMLQESQTVLLADLILLVTAALVIWVDHIQSIVTAVLSGLLASVLTRSALTARVAGGMLFLLMQIFVYVLIVLLYGLGETLLATTGMELLHLRLVIAGILLPGAFLIREAALHLLVYWLLRVYQETPAEFRRILV